MRRMLFLLPLLLGGCSCQPESARTADVPDNRPPPQDVSEAGVAALREAEARNQPARPPSAVAADAVDEPTLIRNYVNVLLRPDRSLSDAFWRGGSAGPQPDDQLLRAIPNLRAMRVDTAPPIARDTVQPSRLREVPVRVRAVTTDATFYYDGWYRLEPRADGSGWEITGASLQPVLR